MNNNNNHIDTHYDGHKRSKECNLPDLNRHQTASNRMVAKHTAKKTIKVFKRIDCLNLLS